MRPFFVQARPRKRTCGALRSTSAATTVPRQAQRSWLDVFLMDVAPAPRFSGLQGLHDRVLGENEMRVRVSHR
jgi:hypothetical protein